MNLLDGSGSCHWQVCLFSPFSIFWELPANFHNGKNRSTKCWFYFRSAENFFPSSSGTILYLEISSLVDPLFPFSLPCYCSARNFPICFPFAKPLISRSAFHTTSTFKWTESLEPHHLHLVNHFERVLNKVTKGQKKKHCLTLKNSGRTGRCVKPWKSLCMSNCVFFCKTYKPSDGGSWLLWPGGIIFNREINDEESCVTPSLGWLNIRKST